MIRNISLFICDIQRKVLPNISNKHITQNINLLYQTSYYLPNFKSNHIAIFKPDKLGDLEGIDNVKTNDIYIKENYSMINNRIINDINQNNITDVILTGVETQWCIAQTAIELLNNNIKVHLPYDAVGSQSKFQNDFSYKRLVKLGCIPGTSLGMVSELIKEPNNEFTKWYLEQYKHLIKNSCM